jgi:hypothetical protein
VIGRVVDFRCFRDQFRTLLEIDTNQE